MALFIDVFGFLNVVLRGLVLIAAALTLGGIAFDSIALGTARNTCPATMLARMAWLRRAAAATLCLLALLDLLLNASVLRGTIGVSMREALTAHFAIAAVVMAVGAAALAGLSAHGHTALRVAAGAAVLGATVATTHAVARIEHRELLLAASAAHQLGAALWLGGIPYFLLLLADVDGTTRRAISLRFSHLCAVGVALIVASAAIKVAFYIGDLPAAYGTAYGIMSGTKLTLFVVLLLFGAANFVAVRRFAVEPGLVARVRRFAEIECLVGMAVFFCAASLTSQPPAVDLVEDRVTWNDIVTRVLTPKLPRLQTPDHAALGIPAEQARLDALAAQARRQAPMAYIPGAGLPAPSTAADIAWSEYNHNWSGIFVALIGTLALLAQLGFRPARHWPMVFLVLAVFIAIRADPEAWPLGSLGFFESMRAPEVLQHRLLTLLVATFGLFEWRVRTGGLANTRAAYVFPISNIVGGILLLTHSHDLNNVREALLAEMSHTPMALFALAAGCGRWLELRTTGTVQRVAAWIWPLAFIGVGLVLIFYRES